MAEIHPAKGGASLDDDGLPQLGDVIAGKYRLERIVGRGGMGIVFAAQHQTLGQSVAIKVLLLSEFDEPKRVEAVARFMREGQAAARLTPSDHVVRIYDFGTLDSWAAIHGHGVAPRGRRRQLAVPPGGAADRGRGRLHRAGLRRRWGSAQARDRLHRDLKPSNLFVSLRSDGRAHVKVLDFGISKAIPGSAFDGNLYRHSFRGRVAVLHVSGAGARLEARRHPDRHLVARHDLVRVSRRRAGVQRRHVARDLRGHRAADVPLPWTCVAPVSPRNSEAIVMRCLEKDPKRRFQSIQELASAVLPFMRRAAARRVTSNTSLEISNPPRCA